ncbi:MAG: hypothetical protein GKS00_24650 [Alphaproteobacteria bacterium]|nr:hypothetical protein [Alphaproteobacteria bacterium]
MTGLAVAGVMELLANRLGGPFLGLISALVLMALVAINRRLMGTDETGRAYLLAVDCSAYIFAAGMVSTIIGVAEAYLAMQAFSFERAALAEMMSSYSRDFSWGLFTTAYAIPTSLALKTLIRQLFPEMVLPTGQSGFAN